MYVILNVLRDRGASTSRPDKVKFVFVGWKKCEVFKINIGTQDELLARILDAAACIKKREDQLRRTTRDLRTRVAKCTEVDGGISEHLL